MNNNEGRKFTIEERVDNLVDSQISRNNAAMAAGIFIVLTTAEALFGNDLASIASQAHAAHWTTNSIFQFLQQTPEVATLLGACSGGFLLKYFRDNKKFKKAKQDLIETCTEEKGVIR